MSEATQDHEGADTLAGLSKHETVLKATCSCGREPFALGLQVSPQAKVWLTQGSFGKS